MKKGVFLLFVLIPLLGNAQHSSNNRIAVSFSTIENQPQLIDLSDIKFIRAPYKGGEYFNYSPTRDYILSMEWVSNTWFNTSNFKRNNSISLGMDIGTQSFNYSYTFNDGVTKVLNARSLSYNVKLMYNYTFLNTHKSELWMRTGVAYIKYMKTSSSLVHNESVFSARISGSNKFKTTGIIRTPISLAYQYKVSPKGSLFINVQTYLKDVYNEFRSNKSTYGSYKLRLGGFRVYNNSTNSEDAYGPMHVKDIFGRTNLTIGYMFCL